MLKFTLPVENEEEFSKLSYGEKMNLMQQQLDVHMLTNCITAKSIQLDPETREVVIEEEATEPAKVLTVYRTTYGVSKSPVLSLDYGDGRAIPTYEIFDGQVNIDLVERIGRAIEYGYAIKFDSEVLK